MIRYALLFCLLFATICVLTSPTLQSLILEVLP